MSDTSDMTEYPDVTDWGRIDPERRGRWGRWLYAMRWRRNRMTQDTVRELLAAAGHPISESYYSDFEGGQPPNDYWQEAFRRLWNDEPATPEPPPQHEAATSSADLAALVAELRAQAAATRQLAAAVAQLAESVGHSHGLSHAAADGMTSTVLSAIENVRGILLERVPAPADTPPRHPVEQVPDPKA